MNIENPMTKAKLIELLRDIPDDTFINVLNEDGESTANIEFWLESTDAREWVRLKGLKPFWKSRREEWFLKNRGTP